MSKLNKTKPGTLEDWKKHRLYNHGVSFSRIVTRSQTGFIRIKHTPSDSDLLLDKSRYQPPGLPHVMVTMKGRYGALPMTTITRSTGHLLGETPQLIEALEKYKEYNSS